MTVRDTPVLGACEASGCGLWARVTCKACGGEFCLAHSRTHSESSHEADAVLVVPSVLDFATRDSIVNAAEQTIASMPGIDYLVLDMGAVEFVDSSGLAALIVIRRGLLQIGAELKLRDVPERAAVVLARAGLNGVFELD